jgi:hypothetical protein
MEMRLSLDEAAIFESVLGDSNALRRHFRVSRSLSKIHQYYVCFPDCAAASSINPSLRSE